MLQASHSMIDRAVRSGIFAEPARRARSAGRCGFMRRRWYMAVALVGAGCMLFPALGRIPVRRQQEARVLLVARDMARGGSWIVPHFRGKVRLNKPPLAYWITAAAFGLTGRADSAAVGRFPAACAGVATAGMIYAIGAAAHGRRRALVAAALGSGCLMFIRGARLAETDVYLCLFTSVAAACFLSALLREESAAQWWMAGGMASGLAFLAKGPAALLPVITAAAAVALDRRRRGTRTLTLWGGTVFLAVFLPALWYLVVIRLPETQSAVEAEVSALLGGTDHPGPWYYYLARLPVAFIPWSLFLPFGLVRSFRRSFHNRAERFILLWWGVTFVALSLLRNKQQHYAMLLLPSTAILSAPIACRAIGDRGTWRGHWARWYLAILCAAGATLGAGLAVAASFKEVAAPEVIPLAVGLVFLPALAALGLLRRRPAAALGAMVMTIAAAAWMYAAVLVRYVVAESVFPELARRARSLMDERYRLYAAGARLGALAFYLDRPFSEVPVDAIERLRLGREEALLVYERCQRIVTPPDAEAAVRLCRHGYCGVLFVASDAVGRSLPSGHNRSQ